jgi:hypothetical protein
MWCRAKERVSKKSSFPRFFFSKNEFEDLKVKLNSCSVSILHDLQNCIGDILRRDAPLADAIARRRKRAVTTTHV